MSFSSISPGTICVVTYTNGWYHKNSYTVLTLNINSTGSYPLWLKIGGGSNGSITYGVNAQANMNGRGGNPSNPPYGLHMWFDDMWIIPGYTWYSVYSDSE